MATVSTRLMPGGPLLAALVISVMLAGCPKAKPPAQDISEPVRSESTLQIDQLRPDSTTEGRGVTVRVEGRGFREGSEVFLNSHRARGVDLLDSRELSFRASEDLKAGTYDVRIVTPGDEEAIRRDGFTVLAPPKSGGDCDLQVVQFDFNEVSLTTQARQVLAANARCLETRKIGGVLLAGHADERGSTEYNLSLGQRRAESVRQYLVNLGIGPDVLSTISYGEEHPSAHGHDEFSWARNRRVEFVSN